MMNHPYGSGSPMFGTSPFQRMNVLPQQQVIQVNGKSSVDSIQMAPNSSVLLMDTSAPIVWLCVSDGVGNVTSTPYDISIHQEKPPVDMQSIEQRLAAVESSLAMIIGGLSDGSKSNAGDAQQKPSHAIVDTD